MNRKISRIRESIVSDSLPFVQQGKWNYVSKLKGEQYITTAMAMRFRTCNELEFSRFLNDLYNDSLRDAEAGERMRRGREEADGGEVEIETEATDYGDAEKDWTIEQFDREFSLDSFAKKVASALVSDGIPHLKVKRAGDWRPFSDETKFAKRAEIEFDRPVGTMTGLFIEETLSFCGGTAKLEAYGLYEDKFRNLPMAYTASIWEFRGYGFDKTRLSEFVRKIVSFVGGMH